LYVVLKVLSSIQVFAKSNWGFYDKKLGNIQWRGKKFHFLRPPRKNFKPLEKPAALKEDIKSSKYELSPFGVRTRNPLPGIQTRIK
jgi:hypothetical protein